MLPCSCSVIDHRWRQNVVKTKKLHMSHRRVTVTDVFSTFWHPAVWSGTEQTHIWQERIYFFIQWSENKKDQLIQIAALYHMTVLWIVLVLWGILKSQMLLFISASSYFLYLTCIQFLQKVSQLLLLLKAE